MTAPTVSAALASQALEQHIGWIRIYAEDMTGGNWRDMALRIKRQVNELEETVKAEVLRLGEDNEKLQKLAQEGDGARMQRDALSRVIDDKDAIIAEAESRALQAVAREAELVGTLKVAVRQNQCDMVMTGDEIRRCEKIIRSSSKTALLMLDVVNAALEMHRSDDAFRWAGRNIEFRSAVQKLATAQERE